MKLAHEIYQEAVLLILKVELKRGEQETPFSGYVSSIQAIYGIDVMIQILTALGKETLQRSSGYYSSTTERKAVLSHLLKVCRPKPEETAAAGGAGHVCAAVDSSFGGIFESAGIPERLLLFYGPHRGTAG